MATLPAAGGEIVALACHCCSLGTVVVRSHVERIEVKQARQTHADTTNAQA